MLEVDFKLSGYTAEKFPTIAGKDQLTLWLVYSRVTERDNPWHQRN